MSRNGLLVCEKRCDECLYSSNRIVSSERASEIMREVILKDTHFVCHKSKLRTDGEDVVCRGSYDRHAGNLIRIMERLGGIKFVDPETGKEVETNEVS